MKVVEIIIIVIFLGFVPGTIAQTPGPPVTEESIRADMQLHVCKNDDRLEAVKNLFKKLGAADSDITIEKFDSVQNVVVSKKGKTDATIIVGAHYDKVADGCGAIDNWTGVVILANLFASFRNMPTDKTLVFVAFGKEEKGLVGSNAMAKSIPKEKRSDYCAMINFDSFGLHYPQVLSNSSNSKMTKFAKDVAAEVKMPLAVASLAGVADSDSSSFLNKDIPAITFHGLSAKWAEYLHTSKDKLENVSHQSVLVGYNFGKLYLHRVDGEPCGAFKNNYFHNAPCINPATSSFSLSHRQITGT